MLTAKLILERLDKEGRLLERREQLSRSFVLQCMDFLYLKHAQVNRDTRDIDNTLRTLNFDPSYNQYNLLVASPPGHAGVAIIYFNNEFRTLEGQDVGIQIGRGTTSPAPTDYKMEDRVEHGRYGKTGVKADFNNPSFETGALTNWTEAHNGGMAGAVSNGAWTLKDGTYFCTLLTTGAFSTGDYAQVSQDIDLTSISHLRFQLRGEQYSGMNHHFGILVDGHPVYGKQLSVDTDYPNEIADVRAFTGVCTVTFRCTATGNGTYANNGAYLDNIETLGPDPAIEYGGTEVLSPTFAGADGQFTIRRYFTNNSGLSITVNEVGIQAAGQDTSNKGYAFLIARDLVSPGVTVLNTQLLRATYVPQITV